MNIFDYLAILAVLFLLYSSRLHVWRLLGSIIQSYWYKFFIKPPALALPSVTLACYKIESVNAVIPPEIIKFIDDKILFVVAGLFLVPVIAGLEDIVKAKSSKYSDDLSTEGLFLLLAALDSPVDKKMDRFLIALNSRKNKKDPADVFNTITEPKKQLAEITRAIHVFFVGWSKIFYEEKIEFVTVVFRMKSNLAIGAWSYYPESEIPEQKLIEDTDSLAANAVEQRKIIIISDIEKERKRKNSLISKHCLTEEGSAICYPISTGHTKGSIPLVIRITTNKPFFKKENRLIYKQILEKFKKRILIEYALSELKDRTISNDK